MILPPARKLWAQRTKCLTFFEDEIRSYEDGVRERCALVSLNKGIINYREMASSALCQTVSMAERLKASIIPI